ncbi:unnamed protein product [Lota lota]
MKSRAACVLRTEVFPRAHPPSTCCPIDRVLKHLERQRCGVRRRRGDENRARASIPPRRESDWFAPDPVRRRARPQRRPSLQAGPEGGDLKGR